MKVNKVYYRINWENYPSDATPLNEQNLNKIDSAVDEMDNRIISLDTTKFDKAEAQLLVRYIEYDEDTGIFKITHYNGASYTIDTLLEKLAINFDYDYQTQMLIIELSDGTVKYVDLSALLTQYEFLDSETVAFTVDNSGKVTAKVKEGSIQEKHLRPDYLADIKVEVAKAEASAEAAEASQKAAAISEQAAFNSAEAAKISQDAAKDSENSALESATAAEESKVDAAGSAQAADASAIAAEESRDAAASSAQSAEVSADSAEESKEEAAGSAQAAAGSAAGAKDSQDAAKLSENNAAASALAASESEEAAFRSAQAAEGSAENAKDSQDAAKLSEDNAAESAIDAGESATAASGSAQAAAGSAADAKASEDAAEASAGQAEDFSLMSKSYAVGTEGTVRPGDATDNSKFYSDLAQYLTDEAAKLLDQAQKLISAATAGAIIPSGTVAFENLPTEPQLGYMYNISNSFVTDDRFAEGPGIQYNPGANVYWTRDGQWDVMIGVQVTGVKGAAESFYRQGNVDITPTNIGLGNVPNVTTNDQTPTFTKETSRENINSGETISIIFGKVKKWFSDLKDVSFTGSYTDLTNTPAIPDAVRVKGNIESTYRTGDVNLRPDDLGAVPWYRNNLIVSSTDWDTIREPGTYKVQGADMSAPKHAPVGEYHYGILQVLWSEADIGERRILQIYYPHHSANAPHPAEMHIRMYNGGAWTNWSGVYGSGIADNRYLLKNGGDVINLGTNGVLTINGGMTNENDDRHLEIRGAGIKCFTPSSIGYAGGLSWAKSDGHSIGSMGACVLDPSTDDIYYYVGRSYDNPNGHLFAGAVNLKGDLIVESRQGAKVSIKNQNGRELALIADNRANATLRGLYDTHRGRWIICTDDSQTYMSAGVSVAGNIVVEPRDGAKISVSTASGKTVALHAGAGGVNRGVHDVNRNVWMIYGDDNNTYLPTFVAQGPIKSQVAGGSWSEGITGAKAAINMLGTSAALGESMYCLARIQSKGGTWCLMTYQNGFRVIFAATGHTSSPQKTWEFNENGTLTIPNGLSMPGGGATIQGKVNLQNNLAVAGTITSGGKYLLKRSVITAATDLNTLNETGIYHIQVAGCSNAPTSSWGTVFVDASVGTWYQLYIVDGGTRNIYKRAKSSGAWGEWHTLFDYNLLSNKPAIGNGTITIKQNGTNKGSFTLNQTGNTTFELTDNNTTYSAATTSAAGLMSAADKIKANFFSSSGNTISLASGKTMQVGQFSIAAGGNELICSGNAHLTSNGGGHVYTHGTGLAATNKTGSGFVPCYASSFSVQSSRRFKKNIRPMTEDRARILLNYKVVNFDYINEENGVDCDGLVAEDLNEIYAYPIVMDGDSIFGIDYSKIVPQLIKMVQIQQKDIELLQTKYAELEKQLLTQEQYRKIVGEYKLVQHSDKYGLS